MWCYLCVFVFGLHLKIEIKIKKYTISFTLQKYYTKFIVHEIDWISRNVNCNSKDVSVSISRFIFVCKRNDFQEEKFTHIHMMNGFLFPFGLHEKNPRNSIGIICLAEKRILSARIGCVKLGAHCAQLLSDWINWPNLFEYSIPFIHPFIHPDLWHCVKHWFVALLSTNRKKVRQIIIEWRPTFTFDSNEIPKKTEAFHQQLRCV